MKVELDQLCHVFDGYRKEYELGLVKEIYDEYIVIKKKYNGNCRIRTDELHDTNQVKFLHRDGQPIIVKKGFLGYKFP